MKTENKKEEKLQEKPLGYQARQALKRPKDFEKLSPSAQWEIDRMLGILDWDGDPST